MFSIVILTLNEEQNLPRCLASAGASDDIVVLDSGSSDRTAEIARAAGARVFVHRFENFAEQRNYAHQSIPFRHPWVFHLDADEQLTPELIEACTKLSAQNPADFDGFLVAPKMFFRSQWIPHCTDFPAYQARFAHAERFRFIQVGHGQREAPGLRLGKIEASYLHDLSADGETALENKHRHYAVTEAKAYLERPKSIRGSHPWTELFSAHALSRRRALKAFSQHLPARGSLRFLYQYFGRGGFLDGSAGLAYCRLLARYEDWIAQEIRRQRRNLK